MIEKYFGHPYTSNPEVVLLFAGVCTQVLLAQMG